jgi:hypothetical protein
VRFGDAARQIPEQGGKCNMAQKSTALVGIYGSQFGVVRALRVLTEAGFQKTEIRVGAVTIPGLGPFAASSPLCAALAGAGGVGAAGGIACPLIGMGISEHEAEHYEGRVEEGGILLSVHSHKSGWARRAKDILERTGAEDISSTEKPAPNYSRI